MRMCIFKARHQQIATGINLPVPFLILALPCGTDIRDLVARYMKFSLYDLELMVFGRF